MQVLYIFNKKPENSLTQPSEHIKDDIVGLINYRRNCRRLKYENVDSKIIDNQKIEGKVVITF